MEKELHTTGNKGLLEIEKLRLEVNSLKRVWWKTPAYIGAFVPALLTLISLIYAISSGFFDKKYEIYQLEKEGLKLEILRFENQKETILAQRDSALIIANNLKLEIELLRTQLSANSTGDSPEFTYDKIGRITGIKGTDKLTTKYLYDDSNRLNQIKDANGKVINYKYNDNGEIIKK